MGKRCGYLNKRYMSVFRPRRLFHPTFDDQLGPVGKRVPVRLDG
jgi:hypothetical protein